MNPGRRIERVAELLKRELSEILRRELNVEQSGLLTVHEVVPARDLRTATVFLGFVGSASQRKNILATLEERVPRLQEVLGAAVRLKFTPVLRFQLDESVERGMRVLQILDGLDPEPPSVQP